MNSPQPRTATMSAQGGRGQVIGLLGLAAVMATSLLLSGCNTTAGVGRDVSATGAAVTRSATDVKQGL